MRSKSPTARPAAFASQKSATATSWLCNGFVHIVDAIENGGVHTIRAVDPAAIAVRAPYEILAPAAPRPFAHLLKFDDAVLGVVIRRREIFVAGLAVAAARALLWAFPLAMIALPTSARVVDRDAQAFQFAVGCLAVCRALRASRVVPAGRCVLELDFVLRQQFLGGHACPPRSMLSSARSVVSRAVWPSDHSNLQASHIERQHHPIRRLAPTDDICDRDTYM